MYRALLYKEWIKLRWFLLALLALTLFTHLKIALNLSAAVNLKGAYHLWYMATQKGAIFYRQIKYIAPFAGLVVALVQFVPETGKRRLRLLFHLPVDHNRALGFMLACGLSSLLLLVSLNLALLHLCLAPFFPAEIIESAWITSMPWFCSAFPAYLITTLAILETTWWRKAVYGATAASVTHLFFPGMGFNAFEPVLWKYLLAVSPSLFTILLPAYRFKRGLH